MMINEEEKILLTMYYMGKLVEGGFAHPGGYRLSTTGFDMAMDLVDRGEKLVVNDVIEALHEIDIVNTDSIPQFAILIMSAQDIGIDEMNEKIKQNHE
jgi:ornithine carbamoyltransferase